MPAGRPAADLDIDLQHRRAEILDFIGIESGMTVIDLVAAGGYTTVLLHTVGTAASKVCMQNASSSLTGERGERTQRSSTKGWLTTDFCAIPMTIAARVFLTPASEGTQIVSC